MTLRKSFLAEPYYRWLDKRILPHVNRLTLSPNQFTLVGFLLAAAVPIGFLLNPVVGLFFMLFFRYCRHIGRSLGPPSERCIGVRCFSRLYPGPDL